MLGQLRCVTITCPDLKAVESAYIDFFNYRIVDRSKVNSNQAISWGAPLVEGANMLTISPAIGDDFSFRFIQAPAQNNYLPLTTFGWNASEIIVKNVDEVAAKLAHSPFEIIGEPRDLSFSSDIRAMQVLGPANEVIYLTEFKNNVPGLSVPKPKTSVDKAFIVILGGPSINKLQSFFSESFGIPEAEVVESRVTILSKALDISIETLYPIAALQLLDDSLIEIDEMPPNVGPRDIIDGLLPPGIAIVSFDCDAPPNNIIAIDNDTFVTKGSTGELIELHVN